MGALNWVIGSMMVMAISAIIFIISLAKFSGDLRERLYPSGNQPLATTCYVDEKVKEKVEEKWDGYFIGNTHFGLLKNVQIPAKIIEKREEEYKVNYICGNYTDGSLMFSEKWLPKKDFYKYPTQEELAQMYKKVMKEK
jgi:hypothetical protein